MPDADPKASSIPELFSRGRPVFSFEFFLPKPPQNIEDFLGSVRELKLLNPSFVTLTYGAGGSERAKTVETAGIIQNEIGLETACHLACITHTRREISELLDRLAALGIRHVVALRGDKPKDVPVPPPEKRDFPYARDLVAFIKARGGFRIAAAGYPEVHPEAASAEEDLRHLAQKVQAGADWVVTQLFFNNRSYFDFVRKARRAGISVPIVPGIMPVTSYPQLQRFVSLCGVKLPHELSSDLNALSGDRDAVVRYGVDYAVRQCRELLQGGAPGIHFYTLNKSHSTAEILKRLRA